MRAWRPLLDGEPARAAHRALDELTAQLRDDDSLDGDPSVNGLGGRALLWAYLERARPGEGFGELAAGCLDRAIDQLASESLKAGLYEGFTGTAWVVDHLDPRAEEDWNEQIDEGLLELLEAGQWPHDLTTGLAGFGLYALGRLHRPNARACLERVVQQLETLASPRACGLSWRSARGFDYGVAHGVPPVLLMLAGAMRSGVARSSAAALYEGAMQWQWAGRLPAPSPSVFAYVEGDPPEPARLGWCYGDAGAGATLLAAARAAGDAPRAALALEVARSAAARDPDGSGAVDGALCHGASGIALLLQRLWHETGEPAFAEASRRWYARLLAQPLAGHDATFLTGTTGIALALLAAVTAVEPAWDAVLAASLPGTLS